jgi:predicted nucleic acid-binding protein
MKYLVDANVLSEPTKPTPDPRVVAWLRANEQDIAVDPISGPPWGAGSTRRRA